MVAAAAVVGAAAVAAGVAAVVAAGVAAGVVAEGTVGWLCSSRREVGSKSTLLEGDVCAGRDLVFGEYE